MSRATSGHAAPVTLVPPDVDPLIVTAEQILDHFASHLPDLSSCQVLLAEERAAGQLRSALLEGAARRGFSALLGPSIESIDQWLTRISPLAQQVLTRPAQELVLAEALRGAARIYAETDPWLLSDQLLTLFDELTRSSVPVADHLEVFQATLQDSYGIHQPNSSLQQEAYILHTLWHAWKKQLASDQVLDPVSAYQAKLHDSVKRVDGKMLWLAGFTGFSPAELRWVQSLAARQQVRLILHGGTGGTGYHPETALNNLVQQLELGETNQVADQGSLHMLSNELFMSSPENLKQRATRYANHHPEDVLGQTLRTFPADSPEQEAQGVALQIRRWLLDDIRPIAIITEDRRLARRVRALLEASNIELEDPGGWALSTTSAAAVLERWLETVEEDFSCTPLLDVLKSPFVHFTDRDTHLAQVRRFEQDIILHENIARGLDRYRYHLDARGERLPDWSEPMRRSLHQMLNKLDHAASQLQEVITGSHPAGDFLDALISSLTELGCHMRFSADAAGRQLLEVLMELQRASRQATVQLTWPEFRDWLGRNLERASFRPPTSTSPVQLLTFTQSRLQRFAATIVAGCSQKHLPGSPAGQAFFNQRVRTALGLPSWSQIVSEKLHHFFRTLQSADRILLTWHREQDGESVAVSPWIELLDCFYQNGYGRSLRDDELARLVSCREARPATPDRAALPMRESCPQPQVPDTLLPKSWTAYTHQRLIDCPYRFFAADTLNLKPQDEIREALSKSDYGSLVHRIIQSFNSDVAELPGPWKGTLGTGQTEAALRLLEEISRTVFYAALKENFQALSWFRQWQNIMPAYLDWETTRRASWRHCKLELQVEKSISANLQIKGRIDRIDTNTDTSALIDFKTGHVPSPEEVLDGESVQLPSYALMLDEPIHQLDYLQIGKDDVKTISCANGDALQSLLKATEQRLLDLDNSLRQLAPLPAWGDPGICNWCEFDGVCRRDMWLQAEQPDA